MSLGLGPLQHLKMPAFSSLLENALSSRPCGGGEADDPPTLSETRMTLPSGTHFILDGETTTRKTRLFLITSSKPDMFPALAHAHEKHEDITWGVT